MSLCEGQHCAGSSLCEITEGNITACIDRVEEIEVFLQRREKTHTTGMHCFGSALLGVMKPFSLFVLAVLDNAHFQHVAVG